MSEKKVVYVCHGMYGCETGCCGYRLCLDDEGDEVAVLGSERCQFQFAHPDEDQSAEDFAREMWDHVDYTNVEVHWGKWKGCD